MSGTSIQSRRGQRRRCWPAVDHTWHFWGKFPIAAHGGCESQLRGGWTAGGTGRRHLSGRWWRIGHGVDRISIDQRTAIRRRRNAQGQLGRFGTIAIVVARDRGSQQRHSRSCGRGRRHGEIALPLPRQEQLVGVGSSSQIGGVVGGHFGECADGVSLKGKSVCRERPEEICGWELKRGADTRLSC